MKNSSILTTTLITSCNSKTVRFKSEDLDFGGGCNYSIENNED